MTKAGSDHLKHQARILAAASGRRLPAVLAELRRGPHRPPSKELVLRCRGMAHPIDGGRCAQPDGHPYRWQWCGTDPHFPVHIWHGYHEADNDARRAEHEAWLASLTPEQLAAHEYEERDAYYQEMADEGRDPHDPYDDKYELIAMELADEDDAEDHYEDGEEDEGWF